MLLNLNEKNYPDESFLVLGQMVWMVRNKVMY